MSLADEIERAREIMATVVRVDLAWKDCFPLGTPWAAIAKSRYLDTLDRAATRIVAVLRVAEWARHRCAELSVLDNVRLLHEHLIDVSDALRRAMEDCDEA